MNEFTRSLSLTCPTLIFIYLSVLISKTLSAWTSPKLWVLLLARVINSLVHCIIRVPLPLEVNDLMLCCHCQHLLSWPKCSSILGSTSSVFQPIELAMELGESQFTCDLKPEGETAPHRWLTGISYLLYEWFQEMTAVGFDQVQGSYETSDISLKE